MDSWKRYKAVFLTLATPATLWLLIFFIIPVAFLFVLSLSSKEVVNGEVSANTYSYFTGFSNYIRAFEPIYLEVTAKTVVISVFATLLCLVVAYPIAFGICFAPARWRPLLLMLVVLPFWINLLIRTYALIVVLGSNSYITLSLNYVLKFVFNKADLPPVSLIYNNFAVIFGLFYVYMPFMVLPLYATIERLDRTYLEASLDLGASQWKTFWKVTVPLTMPGIVTGIILVFIPCLGSFLTPELLGGANGLMIGSVIERQFKSANDWPFGSALSFLLMFGTFIILLIRALYSKRSEGVDV